jgi:catechol 2,3-dioxygenase
MSECQETRISPMLTALQAGAYFHHLHLHSPDVDTMARFYADVMDMEMSSRPDGSRLIVGPGRRLLFSAGPAKRLAHAAFAVRDRDCLGGLQAHAKKQRLNPVAVNAPMFSPGAFAVTDPDENLIVFGLAAEPTGEPQGPGRLRGPIQHLALATRDVGAIENFYAARLGFGVSDRVVDAAGRVTTSFMRGNHQHHTIACLLGDHAGVDHHAYEAGAWDTIRDWCDHFAAHGVSVMGGPGRHGPGNNLFVRIEDPDKNRIEISAELEVIDDRPAKEWPHGERTLDLWGRAVMRS